VEEKKVEWVKRTSLIDLRKLNWIYIDELLVKEFIYNFRHVDQYIKLNGKHFNLGEGAVQVFTWEKIVARRRKKYNSTITVYFTRTKHEHDVPRFGYLITKALGRQKLI
jgi:hypothetical protein